MTVNGTLNVTSPASFAAEDTGNFDTEAIFVNGTMNVTSAVFTRANGTNNTTNTTSIQVNSGGHLTATGSTFGWDVLAWANGSVLNANDVTGNGFDTTVYLPALDVPLLTNNLRFQDVNLNSGGATGAALALNPLGTANTVNQRYVFSGLTGFNGTAATFAIPVGAAVSFGSGATVLIRDAATVTVNGTLNVTSPASFAAEDTGNFDTEAIFVNGTMNVTSAVFTRANGTNNTTNTTSIQVGSGGHLTATGSTFGWDVLAWANGSVLNANDVTGNGFDTTVYLPALDVPLLTNNLRFQDVNLNSGGATGAALALNPLGTANTVNQRYVFSGLTGFNGTAATFAIPVGAAVSFGSGATVLIRDAATVTVNGTLNVTSPASFAAEDTGNFDTEAIFVNGTMNVTSAVFTRANGTNNTTNTTSIQVGSGGHLTATGSTFGWDVLAWANGSVLNANDVTGNGFDTTVYLPALDVPLLTNNLRFQDVNLNSGGATGAALALNPLGTANTVNQRYVFSGLTGFGGTAATFAIPVGAAVSFGSGATVLIRDAATVTVNGTLNVTSPASFAAEDTGNFDTEAIFVNGTMNVTSAVFTRANGTNNTTNTTSIQVNSGGHLTATGSTFGWDVLAWANGSVLNANDVTGNGFDTTVYLPALDVPLLTNNLRFQDVNLNSGGATGAALALNPLGTANTVNQRYVFSGLTGFGGTAATFAIPVGAAVSFGSGATVLIRDAATVTVNGTLNVTSPASFAAEDTGNFDTEAIFVNGTMNVTSAVFTRANGTNNTTNTTSIQVGSGGHLTATGSTFGWDVLAWANGSVLNANDVTGNGFDTTVYLPALDVPLLTNNLRFQDVNLNSGGATGAALALNPLGTANTVNQRYVFSGLTGFGGTAATFVIPSGSTVNVGSGTTVILKDNAKVTVNGALNVTKPALFAAEDTGNFDTEAIVVNGSVSATDTVFTRLNGTNNTTNTSTLQVNSGGHLDIVGGYFGWDQLTLLSGSTDSVRFSYLATKLVVDSSATINVHQNDFTIVSIVATGSSGTNIDLSANFWSTTLDAQILGQITDSHTNTALPTVVYQTILTARPVEPLGASAATAYSGGSQSVPLTATITSPSGTVNEGTVTFTILQGTTTIGTAVTVNVVGGVANATYVLPAGTNGTNGVPPYIIKVVYNGTANYSASTDASQKLVVNPIAQTITFSTPTPVTFGTSTVNLVGTSDSGLAVTYTIVSGPGTISGNVVTITGAGSILIRATQAGNTNYTAAINVDQTLVVNKASQTITFNTPALSTYSPGLTINLTGSSSSSLGVTYMVVSGPGTISGSVLTVTGAGSIVVRASQAGNTNYTSATNVDQTFVINQASQAITFNPPTPVTYSAGLTISLTATSSSNLAVAYFVVSGPGTVSGNTLTVTGAGSIVVRADQAGDTNYTAATSVQQTFVINKASQTITFNPPAPTTYAPGLTINLTATGGGSGIAVTYSVISGPGTVSGNVLTVTGAGAIVLQADQIGDGNYTDAPFVQQTLAVGKASQVVTFPALSPVTYFPGETVALSATGGASGNAVTFSVVSGPGTVSGTTLTVTGAGSIVVRADQAGDANYNAGTANQTLAVGKASQVVTFPALSPVTYFPGETVALSATGGASGNAVTFSVVSGPGTVSGTTLTVTGAGSIVVRADQAGDANYNAGTANQTLAVGKASQTISFSTPSALTFGVAPQTLSATSSSNLAVTYTIVSGPGTVSGGTLTVTGAGSIVVRASQAGDGNYLAATSVDQTFVINQASQAITFNPPAPVLFTSGLTINLPATGGGSGLPVTYAVVSGPGTVSGIVLTITGAGAIVVEANQAGNVNYTAATAVQQTVTVNLGSQTITLTPPAPVTFAPGLTINLSATGGASGNPVTYTVVSGPGTISGNVLTITGAGDIVVEANEVGDSNYNAATAVQTTITVAPAAQTITFTPPSGVTFAAGLTINLSATGGASGNPVTYTVVSGPGTVSGTTLTVTGAGDIIVRANQSGNANYSSATVVHTIAIVPIAQAITFAPLSSVVFASGTTVNLAATGGSSGSPVTFSVVSGPATISGSTLTITGAGSVVIAADQLGNNNFSAAATIEQTLTVTRASQSITFASVPPATFVPGLTISLNATGGSSGNAVTYSVVSGPGTISGGQLHVTGAGSIVVAADQAGNANFAAAAGVQQTLVISPASQTITFVSPTTVTFAPGLTINLTAGSTSGLAVTFTVTSGPGTVSGNVLTITGAGTVVVQADQAGSGNYSAASAVSQSVTVNVATQTITTPTVPPVTYTPGKTITLGATGGDSGNPVTYTVVSGPGTITGNVLTVTGSGTIVIQIDQAGNSSYAPVSTQQAINVTQTATNLLGVPLIAVGSGDTAAVNFYNPDGSLRYTLNPFPGFTGGVRTASADFNGDGVADLVVGTGPGVATQVKIFDGKTQAELFSVAPFESSFTGGVYVTAGDVNGDGVPDLAITPDEGGGPRVDVYSGAAFVKLISFFGIDDPNFRGGARATIADVNGDGVGDLIVVAGFGGGPRVAGFDGKSLSATPKKIFADFFALEQALRNGVFVTAGDLNGDGYADLIVGGGPGGGPRVLAFDGKALLNNSYANLANFFGGDVNSRGGIRLAVKDLDGDNRADLVVGSGTGAGSHLTAYYGKNINASGTPNSAFDFDAIRASLGGIFVG
ncbi:FG-GAP-like repeat-containing protein [Limnoglobus roseus]|uniref:FG-GAP-like repeat-containing protein n=1 Tax=Limnoglobus roseus TaxID=2598579 RepID=UPI00143DD3BD|nr:FG-GAP-like repeat-containing protein [Limnoglobus roseus]